MVLPLLLQNLLNALVEIHLQAVGAIELVRRGEGLDARAIRSTALPLTSSPPMWKYGSGKSGAISPMKASRNW